MLSRPPGLFARDGVLGFRLESVALCAELQLL